mgnify:CR=1 FL=1
MIYLTQILGFLFGISYTATGKNYMFALLVFTMLTKIILLPVGLLTQKNSIKMVMMKPKLNMLRVKYFGDKEKIANETTLLYKQEKYNPFASLAPTILQIVILLGVTQVVRQPEIANISFDAMKLGPIDFSVFPYHAREKYLCMPLFAGLSSLVLGIAQNHLNPLQSEQSLKNQMLTNAVSISISFALAAFVPVGVGCYWVFSNLLAILQQWILNIIINPAKYVDHVALEESNLKLSELESIQLHSVGHVRQSRLYAVREKMDYKRFFNVVNKHIVFYSESSGFYKYFSLIIDYLLGHTNLIIHYVTSDPNDTIFQIAKVNARIRPYYIGERRLITLMMKMDADMVVMTMTELGKYHIKRSYVRKDVEYVFTFHYPLSTFLVGAPGSYDNYDTIFCVGEFQINEIRKYEALNNLKPKRLIACGYGQMELLQKAYDGNHPISHEKKQILIAPSWQIGNILDSCISDLLSGLLGHEYRIIVRPHPEYVKRYKDRLDKIIRAYSDTTDDELLFEIDFSSNESIFQSDLIITDWSGIAYEFSFVTGKPALFIDTPMKVFNPNWKALGIEPMELKLRDKIGIRINPEDISDAKEKVEGLLHQQAQYIGRNFALRDSLIANFGHSAEVAGKYIIASLKEKARNRRS